jgi:hypothetical protein
VLHAEKAIQSTGNSLQRLQGVKTAAGKQLPIQEVHWHPEKEQIFQRRADYRGAWQAVQVLAQKKRFFCNSAVACHWLCQWPQNARFEH